MVNLSLRITSMPDLAAWGAAIELGAEDAAPVVAEVLREAADSCFETSPDPWGVAWESLKEATVKERERLGKTGKILIRDGVLRGSIFGTPTGRTENVFTAEIGAGGPAAAYAAHQQFGPWSRAFLPIRPNGEVDLPAALDAEVQATIVDAIDLRMADAMRSDIAVEE